MAFDQYAWPCTTTRAQGALFLQAGGRWFETSRAHTDDLAYAQVKPVAMTLSVDRHVTVVDRLYPRLPRRWGTPGARHDTRDGFTVRPVG
jgi:hypothetical protein